MCFCCFCDLLIYIVSKIYHLLTQWPFVILIIFLILKKPFAEFLKNVGTFSFGKDGVEFKKIIQEAKDSISESQLLAGSVYIPLLDMLARTYLQSAYIIKDKLDTRFEIEKFVKANNINNTALLDKIKSLNDSIISDVLFSIIKKHEHSLLMYEYIDLLKEDTKSRNYKCTPDMDGLKKMFERESLLNTEETNYIFEEANYFIEHKNFKDIDKLINCMNKSMREETKE